MTTIGRQVGDGFTAEPSPQRQATDVRIIPDHAHAEGRYVVLAGAAEIGEARALQEGRELIELSLELDDPSFSAAISAVLVRTADSALTLVWTRRAN